MKISKIVTVGAIALPILAIAAGLPSGPKPGASVYAFEPYHVTGPDAGTVTCPVCKYGFEPGVQVWVHNISDKQVGFIARNLESKLESLGMNKFRAFVVFVEPNSVSDAAARAHLKKLGAENHLKDLALIYVRPNVSALKDYNINLSPKVKSTMIAYLHRETVKTFVNTPDSKAGAAQISEAVNLAIKG